MKVLIYSPYSLWPQHSYFDRLIAKKLESQKIPYLLISCDRFLNFCELNKKCTSCTMVTCRMDQEIQLQSTPISHFLKKPKVHSYDVTNHLSIEYKGFNISQLVKSSYLSYFRLVQFRIETDEQRSAFERLVTSSVNFIDAMENAFDEFKPTHVLTFSGRFFTHQIICEMAKKRNIQIITHELGYAKESVQFKINDYIQEHKDILRDWTEVKNQGMTKMQFLQTINSINQWRDARNRSGRIFVDPKTFQDPVEKIEQQAKTHQKVLLALTSSDDEIAAVDGFDHIFDSQIDWINQTISYLRNHPEVYGIVRFHPNTINPQGEIKSMVEYIQSLLKSDLPNNVTIIPPWTKINTYKLFEFADAAATYGTTAGLEMIVLGKPVLVSRKCLFYDLPFFQQVMNKADFTRNLDHLLQNQQTKQQTYDAIKFFRYYILSSSNDLNLIKYLGAYRPWLNFLDVNTALQDENLEKIYSKMFFFSKNSHVHADDGFALMDEYQINNLSNPRKVLMISGGREDCFFDESSREFNHYKKLILRYGHIPEVVFPTDSSFQRKWYKKEGGFSGKFSRTFRILYWTWFRLPYFQRLKAQLKKFYQRKFESKFNPNVILQRQIEVMQPDYILSYMDTSKNRKFEGTRTFYMQGQSQK